MSSSLPPIQLATIRLPVTQRRTIRFQPLQPERDVLPFFDTLTKYIVKLEKKYNELIQEQYTSLDLQSMLTKLTNLKIKTIALIGLLLSIRLEITSSSYIDEVPHNMPQNIKNTIQPLLQHIEKLDRNVYKGFFKSLLHKVASFDEQLVDLDNKIQYSIDQLRPPRSPRMLFQQIQQQLTSAPTLQLNQLNRLLGPPPPLRRS